MNLILLSSDEIGNPIPGYDPRAKHIRRTLRLQEGDSIAAGIINGPIGKAKIISISKKKLILTFTAEHKKTTPYPVTLIVGLTRPQIAKHIMRESAAMGITALWFYPTQLGEKSYLSSNFWKAKNYLPQLIKGASQGVTTNLPDVTIFDSLATVFDQLPTRQAKIALDNNRPTNSIRSYSLQHKSVALLLGSERGLTDRELDMIEAHKFTLLKMGNRVLRTDTACIAGVTLVLSKLGYI